MYGDHSWRCRHISSCGFFLELLNKWLLENHRLGEGQDKKLAIVPSYNQKQSPLQIIFRDMNAKELTFREINR